MKEFEEKIMSLQNQFNDSKNLNDEQQNKIKELETSFQNKISDSEKVNSELKSQLDDSNNLIN